jgi:[ribosomal protein S5]-alanine N-acetyltransferase
MTREVRTERLTLRPLTEKDRSEFLRIHTVSADFFRPWFPVREESLEALFEKELAKNRGEEHFRWAAELADGKLAGFFNLSNIVRGVFQNAYASWSVSVDAAGQGFATEGVHALLDLAFSEAEGLGLHRVQANIIPGNERSLRLARRVGLRKEGRAKRYLKIAGRWQDHWMYAKTVEEHSLKYLT